MKQALLLFCCLSLSSLSFAQTSHSDNPDHIKIIVGKDGVHVSFRDKSFKINTIQQLDSCLKDNIAGMNSPVADVESFIDLTPGEHRAIIVTLDKYLVPVMSDKRISSGRPLVTRRLP